MKYHPQIHHRRSIRMKGYDYSQAGAYFITICCHNRISRLGTIPDAEMELNGFGQMAYTEWTKLPQRFPNMELDVFQIMPNHVHGIIILNESIPMPNGLNDVGAIPCGCPDGVGCNNLVDDTTADRAGASPAPTANVDKKTASIADIVGAYKSLVANGCLDLFKLAIEAGTVPETEMMGKLWQRNYYEHIIRNDKSYHIISDYIINNPANWSVGTFFNE